MATCGDGDACNQVSASGSAKEMGSKNKRKFLSEGCLGIPVEGSPSSLTEFPRFDLLVEKLFNALSNSGSSKTRSYEPKEEEVKDYLLADWNQLIACQLEDLLSEGLHATFGSAIKKIAANGYSEEVAEQVVLRSGLYYGDKDAVSNIVDGALGILRNEEGFGTSRHRLFEDLGNLVKYTMLEMVYVLMEVKPSLSVVEAMWCLLISDLNLSHACAMEGDALSVLGDKEVTGVSSSESALPQIKPEAQTSGTIPLNTSTPHISKPSNPDPQRLQSEIQISVTSGKIEGITGGHFHTISQTTIMEDKLRAKSCSGNSKRDILRQRALHMEKYRGGMSKGTFKAKHTSFGSLVLEKKQKSPTDSSGAFKNASYKGSTAVLGNASLADGNHHLSCNPSSISLATENHATLPRKDTVSALPAKHKLLKSIPPETKPAVKPQGCTATPDYYAGIPYDKSMGMYVPQNDRDEKLLALVPRMMTLQKELQGWTDWLNKKVAQAMSRLGKDQAELKMLRQEKEEVEYITKGKQILEENTMKRLSEMENALNTTNGQVDMANSTVRRLELENSVLKEELETARSQVMGTTTESNEAELREQETQKKIQSCDSEKGLLLEELTTLKHETSKLQKDMQKTRNLYNQSEALRKQEEKENVKLLTQASSARKGKDRLDALAKEEGDKITQKAEIEMKKYNDKIKELEAEISRLKLEAESSKRDALWREINLGYVSAARDSKSTPALQGYLIPNVHKRLPVFEDIYVAERIKQERECVMCMTEEISAIFLPCAHQVLCEKCNVLHEKQGMNDCPSCRTPIQRRLTTRFAQ